MPLITRIVAPDNKNAKLTSIEMDDNLYYLQALGVSALTFSSNTLTITNPTGGTKTTNINNFTGLTVNGIISATTISGTTLYGNGSNITGLSTQDTFLTGGTYSAGTLTLINNTGGTVSVSGFSSGLPYTIYKALVTLSSGGFTVTQLENTIGDGTNISPNDIQWSNPSNGVIRATKTGAFTSSNILISVENMFANGVPYICMGTKSGPSNNYYIDVYIYPSTFILSSTPYFTNLPVEIRIY
jgi:hypothetical protein